MTKAISLLLLASAFILSPLMRNGSAEFRSAAYAAEEGQSASAADILSCENEAVSEDEDIANVDPFLDEETAAIVADVARNAPVRGIAQAVEPAVEVTQSFASDAAPVTGVSIPVEPAVEVAQTGSAPVSGSAAATEPSVQLTQVAAATTQSDDTNKPAAQTTDLVNVGRFVAAMDDMDGKLVMDQDGELIGKIVSVNDETTTIAVELTNGTMISLLDLPLDLGNGLVAVDLTTTQYVPAPATSSEANFPSSDCE